MLEILVSEPERKSREGVEEYFTYAAQAITQIETSCYSGSQSEATARRQGGDKAIFLSLYPPLVRDTGEVPRSRRRNQRAGTLMQNREIILYGRKLNKKNGVRI
jgi:hypothetical protein